SEGRSGAPPTVYRTLDFLLEQGLVHRLASLNAFVACCDPAERHGGQFLICEACGRVGELNSARVEATIVEEAAAVRFAVSAQTVEVLGRCAACLRLPAGPSA
ncbi:MAG TPA: transcriptional repressor, partial [Plasticicumulans sp.]|nr:transcriptional repressor [Plasticicumulans sp.]